MEKREEQRYKNQLMVAYAKEILKHKNDGTLEKKPNSIDISDFELLHFSVSQLVFEQKDLESLLDCYLFAVGNEKLGQHKNIYGDVKRNISGINSFNKDISETYYGFKKAIFRRIDNVLSNSSGEIQRDFFERILPDKEIELRVTAQASKNNLVRYEERKDEIVERYMREEGLTKDEALTQFFNLENYDGRLGYIAEAGVESIGSLYDNLGKEAENTQHHTK